jgi:hypothetical protein
MKGNQTANVKHKLEDSALDAIPVNVSVTDAVLDTPARAIIVGTTGNLTITTLLGNKRTIPSIPAGTHSIGCRIVHAAGTTASNITVLI